MKSGFIQSNGLTPTANELNPVGTEAARCVLDYGFETLHLSRLVCLVERENLASIRVAQKIGMRFEKEGEDEKGAFLLYTIDKPYDQSIGKPSA